MSLGPSGDFMRRKIVEVLGVFVHVDVLDTNIQC